MLGHRVLVGVQRGEGVVYLGRHDIQEILDNRILVVDEDLVCLQRLNDAAIVLPEAEAVNAMREVGWNALEANQ